MLALAQDTTNTFIVITLCIIAVCALVRTFVRR
jgi:hypothetical protein